MQKIEYYEKNVYGLRTIYILDPETATSVTRLTGRKTITDGDIHYMSKLFGVEFIQVLPQKESKTV